MGQTRIQDMTRAQALRAIMQMTAYGKEVEYGDHLTYQDERARMLQEAHQHKNYHIRVAAWKAQGAPMPKGKDHKETIELTIKFAQDLQPNQVARYFAQQDEELKDTLEGLSNNQEANEGDCARAKEFTNVMKQQFCVSLLARISGQGMVM